MKTLQVNNTQEAQQLMEKVQAIDLEPIAYKLVYPEDGQGWTAERTYKLIELYRYFLVLNEMYPNISIVPTKEIDKVWHTHILDTAKYREDCEKAFGRFVDHFPYFGLRSEEDAKNLQSTYQTSRALFIEHFGVDPSHPVTQVADCGSGSCSPSCNTAECSGCDDGYVPCGGTACRDGYFDRSRPSLATKLQLLASS
jgi:hypothetical protein